jgi:hypothetical protein
VLNLPFLILLKLLSKLLLESVANLSGVINSEVSRQVLP